MDFRPTDQQRAIQENVAAVFKDYDDDYWLARDRDGGFPEDFYRAMAAAGWLGIVLPEEVGGSDLGVTEAALMMTTVANKGGMQAASAIHMNIFGPKAISAHATPEQQQAWLPDLIQGRSKTCFAVTEPNVGLDTANIATRAERTNTGYLVNGRKVWTSTAQVADKVILLARTTPKEQCERPMDGLSLFYTDLDRDHVDVREIEKMGRKAVDSNELFIDGLPVPEDHLIGEEGKGFRYILESLNPERILVGAEAVGIGRDALRRAAAYARDREVFGRPIGQNQAIQHPLAESWVELEAAWLMCMKAAALFDAGEPCGAEANAAKFYGGEVGFRACDRAILTHGGMGYAKEYDVERYLREVMIARIAPVSREMILNYVGERVLGLPRSY